MLKKTCVLMLSLVCFSFAVTAQNESEALKIISSFQQNAFPLVANNASPCILVDTADAEFVRIAARAVASDIEAISGAKPALVSNLQHNNAGYIIIAGTIGGSSAIDALIKTNRLDVSKIQNKWEAFIITTINAPVKGVKQALVIAGSNKRGTAYGLFELSRLAGVSPWVWWADAVPAKSETLSVLTGTFISKEPSVKYRGIFLNDEDWGLQPWAAKTFEPETGDIGPKTYAKIFELLLRLKANLIWPAMHDCTTAFFKIPGNERVAADYSIIIGSSHAEPMLRNNVGEWTEKTMGPFNYVTNKVAVQAYWEERVAQSSGIDAAYSLGMRGVHDSKMEGVNTPAEAVPLLERIFGDQRKMLQSYVNKNITAVPQVFTAYKEVLDIYDNGLRLPDDVTLVWPDDNYGYIQRLNNEAEKARPGGSGVYYHVSYWGRPHDYLWLSSSHPSLIREEMMKAYENGSNRLWVANVGDIKPGEYITEFFLNMAYDAVPFKNNLYPEQHLLRWVINLFGKEKASAIQPVLWEYYRLAFERRPEFMGWSQTEPTSKTTYTAFNHFYYGDEAQKRIGRYQALEDKVKALRPQMLSKDEAAFYQLVYYPVVGASLLNKKFLYRDKSWLYAKQNRLSAADYAQLSTAAYDSIIKETEYYNNRLSGGKWKNMMSMKPRNLPVFAEPDFPVLNGIGAKGWSIAPEGFVAKDSSLLNTASTLALPPFDPVNKQSYFIDVFLCESKTVKWATVSPPWIKLSKASGQLHPLFGQKQERIYVTVDWNNVPKGDQFTGRIEFNGDGKSLSVQVPAAQVLLPLQAASKVFIENNGYVSIKASHYTRQAKKGVGDWVVLPGLGYAGDALQTQAVPLSDTRQLNDTTWVRRNSSYVDYDFYTFSSANTAVTVFTLPTHPLNDGYKMRYAVSVDEGPLQVVDFRTVGRSEEWKQNVLRNRAERKIELSLLNKGPHRLRVYAIDPGVVLDELLIDVGGLKKAYDSVVETRPVAVN